jgi:antitoxin (DNA-binding transcriptional repressor) of toxin-antitoxin stability system
MTKVLSTNKNEDCAKGHCSMNRLTVQDAQIHFPELISNLQPGEIVQIMEGEKIVARLVAELEAPRQLRKPGSAVGTLTIFADDDEHLQAFMDYMP